MINLNEWRRSFRLPVCQRDWANALLTRKCRVVLLYDYLHNDILFDSPVCWATCKLYWWRVRRVAIGFVSLWRIRSWGVLSTSGWFWHSVSSRYSPWVRCRWACIGFGGCAGDSGSFGSASVTDRCRGFGGWSPTPVNVCGPGENPPSRPRNVKFRRPTAAAVVYLQIDESSGMEQLTRVFSGVDQHQCLQRAAAVETDLIQQRLGVFVVQHQIDQFQPPEWR